MLSVMKSYIESQACETNKQTNKQTNKKHWS